MLIKINIEQHLGPNFDFGRAPYDKYYIHNSTDDLEKYVDIKHGDYALFLNKKALAPISTYHPSTRYYYYMCLYRDKVCWISENFLELKNNVSKS